MRSLGLLNSFAPPQCTKLDALNVRRNIFYRKEETRIVNGKRVVTTTPAAVFSSYGCKQGNEDGLAQQLHDIWRIMSRGSRGDTSYKQTGEGEPYPSSERGYVTYQ
jgi:hypothetical protein